MSSPSPLATPAPWDLVAPGYALDVVPMFEAFAADALALAEVRPGDQVLDVATGPGTLALLAARTAQVSAIDFSPLMLEQLEVRAREAKVQLDARHGDGMALPWPDKRFDAAFSMFGLMFFPDRDRGLRELLRVLRPGGRAVISSWTPMGNTPVLAELFAALKAELPEIPFGDAAAPLSSSGEVEAEMTAAGFSEVKVRESAHGLRAASIDEFYQHVPRSNAPVAMLRLKLGEARWEEVSRGLLARLRKRFGAGPQQVDMVALLGTGKRPEAKR